MSLKSFLRKIGEFFSNLFKSLKKEAKKAVEIGVHVTNAIKEWDTAHPEVLNTITMLIPGDIDDKIKDKIREKLPVIMTDLKLVGDTLEKTDAEVILEGAKALQALSGNVRSTFLHSFSILVADVAADGEVSVSDLIYLQEWFYRNEHEVEVDTTVEEA